VAPNEGAGAGAEPKEKVDEAVDEEPKGLEVDAGAGAALPNDGIDAWELPNNGALPDAPWPNNGAEALSESDANVGAAELEESPNLKVDDADGAGAAPNEKPPAGLGGALPPNTIPGVSFCGCEPNVVGAGAELPKVKAGVGACVELEVPPKVGAEVAPSFSLDRRRLLRSSSVSSLFTILPSGTNAFDSVDEVDGALKLKAGTVVGSALVRGAGVPPKLKPVEALVAFPPLLPNEKTGLFEDSEFRSDLLVLEMGKFKLPPFAGGEVLSVASVPVVDKLGFLGELGVEWNAKFGLGASSLFFSSPDTLNLKGFDPPLPTLGAGADDANEKPVGF
jgi:hypothetical protein